MHTLPLKWVASLLDGDLGAVAGELPALQPRQAGDDLGGGERAPLLGGPVPGLEHAVHVDSGLVVVFRRRPCAPGVPKQVDASSRT